jgi:hypothetical protein
MEEKGRTEEANGNEMGAEEEAETAKTAKEEGGGGDGP